MERGFLELERDLEILVHSDLREHLVGEALHDLRARIVALVYAVTESHQSPALAALHAVDERRNVFRMTDLLDHAQHGFICTAVQRAVERGDSGGDGREGIDLG